MSDKTFSVITITGGRNDHLRNLIRGIERSSRKPSELIVIYMNQVDELQVESTIVIHSYHIDSEILPLAKARNEGALRAHSEHMIFLDVDCIPSSTMFEELITSDAIDNSLVMGTPRYLYKGSQLHTLNDSILNNQSAAHKVRLNIQEGFSDDYTSFWSLCFGLTKTTFAAIGGFDPMFIGYGGEDTDFALSAKNNNIPFYIHRALCYHQHHEIYKPPVQHVKDIVTNSNLFYSKWHTWPMIGWLREFTTLGYVRWEESSTDPITIVHLPTGDEQQVFIDTHSAY